MMNLQDLEKINFNNYNPIRTKMFEHKLKTRIQRESSFINCFKKNLTLDFFDEMFDLYDQKTHKHTTNTILQVAGLSGTGKSIAVLSIAKLVCPSFNQENIYFFDQQIIDNVKKLPLGTFAIRDENPNKSVFGTGSSRTGFQIETIADTCRKRGLSLIFVEPRFALNGICKWYLETIDYGSVDGVRFVRMALRDPSTLLFIGSVFVPIVDEDDSDWVNYNDRKDEFMSGVVSGEYKGAKLDYESEAESILEEIDEDIYRTKKEKMFYVTQKYPNLTSGEIKNIMTAISIKERENLAEKKKKKEEEEAEKKKISDQKTKEKIDKNKQEKENQSLSDFD